MLERQRCALWSSRRRGQLWVELGIGELASLASDPARAADLAGALSDPSKSALPAVLPPALRGALGVLVLGENAAIKVPEGGSHLQPATRDELQRLCLLRLTPAAALTATERQRLRRLLLRIDPGAPAEIVAGRRDDRLPTHADLLIGAPVGLHATAASRGYLIAGPSSANLPNVGYAMVPGPHEVRIALTRTPFEIDVAGP